MEAPGILEHLRVIDLSRSSELTRCASTLAAHGAEVISISFTDESSISELDGNISSIVLERNESEHQAVLASLVSSAAILLSDRDDAAMTQIGLDRATLTLLNDRLIFSQVIQECPAGAAEVLCFTLIAALRQAEATGKGGAIRLSTDGSQSQRPQAHFDGFSIKNPAPTKPLGFATEKYVSEAPTLPLSDTDKRNVRDSFGAFATGVTVVTTRQQDGTPRGFTANSFTSVSLDPPMLLVCIGKTAFSCETFMQAPQFAVNILTDTQKQISGLFASRTDDKFDQVGWHAGAMGVPIIDNCLASLACMRERTIDAGDHIILIGRVIDHQKGTGNPLGYFAGQYFSVGLEDELVSAASKAGHVSVGAILVRGRQVLLSKASDGQLSVPKLSGSAQTVQALKAYLEKMGIRAKLDLLFAVFNDNTTGQHGIYYTGTAIGYAPPGHKFYAVDEIPFHKCTNAAERSMLKRYCEEHSHGSFGIYEGDESKGVVHRVLPRAGSET